jgi:hypothetical protein
LAINGQLMLPASNHQMNNRNNNNGIGNRNNGNGNNNRNGKNGNGNGGRGSGLVQKSMDQFTTQVFNMNSHLFHFRFSI